MNFSLSLPISKTILLYLYVLWMFDKSKIFKKINNEWGLGHLLLLADKQRTHHHSFTGQNLLYFSKKSTLPKKCFNFTLLNFVAERNVDLLNCLNKLCKILHCMSMLMFSCPEHLYTCTYLQEYKGPIRQLILTLVTIGFLAGAVGVCDMWHLTHHT